MSCCERETFSSDALLTIRASLVLLLEMEVSYLSEFSHEAYWFQLQTDRVWIMSVEHQPFGRLVSMTPLLPGLVSCLCAGHLACPPCCYCFQSGRAGCSYKAVTPVRDNNNPVIAMWAALGFFPSFLAKVWVLVLP